MSPEDIKEWRVGLGWTQADAAAWFGIAESTWQNWGVDY